MYDFQIKEICLILDKTEGAVKHLLKGARDTMTDIFEHRCALVNKNSVYHQCSQLNGTYNPKQNQQAELMKLQLVEASGKYNKNKLFALRTVPVKGIDLLHASGTDFHESFMHCIRTAIGEKNDFFERTSYKTM